MNKLRICLLLLCVSAVKIQAQTPIRISGDSSLRYTPSVVDTNTAQSIQFVRGDFVTFEVGLFDRGIFRSNTISQFTNITLQVFDYQNSTNGPLMAMSVTNGTAAWNTNCSLANWTNGPTLSTNQNASFAFTDAQTSITLASQASQTYWLRVYAVTTDAVPRTITYMEGPVTIYDGPINPAYAPPFWPYGVFVDASGNLITTNLFSQNFANLTNALIQGGFSGGGGGSAPTNLAGTNNVYVVTTGGTNYVGPSSPIMSAAFYPSNSFAPATNGATLFVAAWGNDTGATGSSALPYQHIQSAITASPAGGLIRVGAGWYNEHINFPTNMSLELQPGATLLQVWQTTAIGSQQGANDTNGSGFIYIFGEGGIVNTNTTYANTNSTVYVAAQCNLSVDVKYLSAVYSSNCVFQFAGGTSGSANFNLRSKEPVIGTFLAAYDQAQGNGNINLQAPSINGAVIYNGNCMAYVDANITGGNVYQYYSSVGNNGPYRTFETNTAILSGGGECGIEAFNGARVFGKGRIYAGSDGLHAENASHINWQGDVSSMTDAGIFVAFNSEVTLVGSVNDTGQRPWWQRCGSGAGVFVGAEGTNYQNGNVFYPGVSHVTVIGDVSGQMPIIDYLGTATIIGNVYYRTPGWPGIITNAAIYESYTSDPNYTNIFFQPADILSGYGAAITLGSGTVEVFGNITSLTNHAAQICDPHGTVIVHGGKITGIGSTYGDNMTIRNAGTNIFYGCNIQSASTDTNSVGGTNAATVIVIGGILTNEPFAASETVVGSAFIGNGGGLINLQSGNLVGTIPGAAIPANVITNGQMAAFNINAQESVTGNGVYVASGSTVPSRGGGGSFVSLSSFPGFISDNSFSAVDMTAKGNAVNWYCVTGAGTNFAFPPNLQFTNIAGVGTWVFLSPVIVSNGFSVIGNWDGSGATNLNLAVNAGLTLSGAANGTATFGVSSALSLINGGNGNALTNLNVAAGTGLTLSGAANGTATFSIGPSVVTNFDTVLLTLQQGISNLASYFQTNVVTGAWAQITTNAHLHLTDEYGAAWDTGTNGVFKVLSPSGVVWYLLTNGSLTLATNLSVGQTVSIGSDNLQIADHSGNLAFSDPTSSIFTFGASLGGIDGTVKTGTFIGTVLTNAAQNAGTDAAGLTTAVQFVGGGSGITALNASHISSGTLGQAYLPSDAVTNLNASAVTLNGGLTLGTLNYTTLAGAINSIVNASNVIATNITATLGFTGNLAGNVTGNLTGNGTGNTFTSATLSGVTTHIAAGASLPQISITDSNYIGPGNYILQFVLLNTSQSTSPSTLISNICLAPGPGTNSQITLYWTMTGKSSDGVVKYATTTAGFAIFTNGATFGCSTNSFPSFAGVNFPTSNNPACNSAGWAIPRTPAVTNSTQETVFGTVHYVL